MGYPSLQAAIHDLERTKQLVRIDNEIDPHLEAAELQRRIYQANGPALLLTRVKGCQFPMACNLFGTLERTRFLFRDTLQAVRHLVELKIDPANFFRNPWRYRDLPRVAWNLRPRFVRSGPVQAKQTNLRSLPQLVSWPDDGGPFITLPQVYTEDADRPGWRYSNLGMYRIQLGGNSYEPNRQIGLHYQLHRGIGVHHARAIRKGVPFRVNIFVGGPPAMTLAAVMPLPEDLPELAFAGALGGRRVRLISQGTGPAIAADADFVITGTVDPNLQLPEGPFGDHLGYYSLTHPFPVLNVEKVYHREGAIWPFTVVGRPPQEDTSFGAIIHEITGPIIPTVLPGLHGIHAVDAAGVHPLLLAIGSERYTPYNRRERPQELLTLANAILGQGQLSLAKFLFIVAREDAPELDLHDIKAFLAHLLERIDWTRDVHFHTSTTIDTLDYSGSGINEGSKVVWAAVGPKRRELPTALPSGMRLPDGFQNAHVVMPGVLAITGPRFRPTSIKGEDPTELVRFSQAIPPNHPLRAFPLLVIVDDGEFTARTLNNFLWVTFTRSNPAADIFGVEASTVQKHWGCRGPLIIDARIKPHHAPPLIEDPNVTKRIDALAAPGKPLHGII